MPPAVWDGVCVLAARSGALPVEWLQQAVRDRVAVELEPLPGRVPLRDGEQGDGYALEV
jgi:hypothetical protein